MVAGAVLSRQCSTHVITCQELQTITAARRPLLPLKFAQLHDATTPSSPSTTPGLAHPTQMASRSPSRGRYRSRTRSPTPRSEYSRSPQRRLRHDSRSPARSPTPPRRNGRYRSRSRSRSWSRGRDHDRSRDRSERGRSGSPLAKSTKVCAPSLGVLLSRRLTSWRPDCGGAPIQEHQRTAPLRDFRAIRSHQGLGSSH